MLQEWARLVRCRDVGISVLAPAGLHWGVAVGVVSIVACSRLAKRAWGGSRIVGDGAVDHHCRGLLPRSPTLCVMHLLRLSPLSLSLLTRVCIAGPPRQGDYRACRQLTVRTQGSRSRWRSSYHWTFATARRASRRVQCAVYPVRNLVHSCPLPRGPLPFTSHRYITTISIHFSDCF